VRYLVGIAAGLLACWCVLVVALLVLRPKGVRTADVLRLMPDLVVLAGGLARDRSIPRTVRARIWVLVAWMASPIDAIPDVIPVIGFADDVVLAYLVLRSVARRAGVEVLARHWRGSPEGLDALERLLGVPPAGGSRDPGDGGPGEAVKGGPQESLAPVPGRPARGSSSE